MDGLTSSIEQNGNKDENEVFSHQVNKYLHFSKKKLLNEANAVFQITKKINMKIGWHCNSTIKRMRLLFILITQTNNFNLL